VAVSRGAQHLGGGPLHSVPARRPCGHEVWHPTPPRDHTALQHTAAVPPHCTALQHTAALPPSRPAAQVNIRLCKQKPCTSFYAPLPPSPPANCATATRHSHCAPGPRHNTQLTTASQCRRPPAAAHLLLHIVAAQHAGQLREQLAEEGRPGVRLQVRPQVLRALLQLGRKER
jgi:hypothetical protein